MVTDLALFQPEPEAPLDRADRRRRVRPPYDAVLMFRLLVLHTLYALSDDHAEYQPRDRRSSMSFARLMSHDPVPDAKAIWHHREQPTRAGAPPRAFDRFDTCRVSAMPPSSRPVGHG